MVYEVRRPRPRVGRNVGADRALPPAQKYPYEPVSSSPSAPPSLSLSSSPFERRRRCAAPSAWACLSLAVAAPTLALYLLSGAAPTPAPTVLAPASTHPIARLAQLNEGYDAVSEGFGVGSASLAGYRDELSRAYEVLFGGERGEGAIDLVRHSKPTAGRANQSGADQLAPLWTTTRNALDPTCALAVSPVPMDLYMTAAEIDPEPPSIPSWREHNPDLDVNLFADPDVFQWIEARFPAGSIYSEFAALPINILQFDLFRLLVLFARGGVYTDADTFAMKAVERWGAGAFDLTDPNLVVNNLDETALSSPPALVVGIEWSGRTETNVLNPLFSRSVGVVQWTFGATKGHPVILDAIRRVVRHSHLAMNTSTSDDAAVATGPLHFDPEADRMVLEWSGPAVLSDALARCLSFPFF